MALVAKHRRRSETVSFRLDPELRAGLEEEASKAGLNLNALVSQILRRYMSWERFAFKLRFLPVSKNLAREVFQALPTSTVEQLSKRLGENSAREHILFLFQKVSPQTVLRFMDLWISHFDACEHRFDGKQHHITIHHDINSNFSIFIKGYVSSLLRGTVGREAAFSDVAPDSITFAFDE